MLEITTISLMVQWLTENRKTRYKAIPLFPSSSPGKLSSLKDRKVRIVGEI